MYVYVVIDENRHTDVKIDVFSSKSDAIEFANDKAIEYSYDSQHFDDSITDSMLAVGWLYHCQYSVDGDSIRVIRTILNSPDQ